MRRTCRLARCCRLWLVAWLLFSGCQLPAQKQQAESLEARLDALVPGLLKEQNVPGVSVAVIRGGTVTWAKGYGLADKTSGRPVGPETRFNIGSVSKTLTAWAVLTLVEKGQIELDAPVEQYLKRWRLPPTQFNHQQVTVRRVLSHTAGLSVRGYNGIYRPGERLPTLETSLAGYSGSDGSLRVIQAPGTSFRYSSGGYTLLQLLIEDVTGESLADYMRRAIFTPLGMTSAGYDWSAELQAIVATPYNATGGAWPHYQFAERGSGGVYLTASDLARFVPPTTATSEHALGRGVLRPETVRLMIEPAAGAEGRYGLGYKMAPLGQEVLLSHDGANEGWRARFMVHPQKSDGVVILTNSDMGGRVMGQIACVCFAGTAVDLAQLCRETIRQ